ncbi:OadG family transporter subunit [Lacticigenium naphthae]|uniref:OadG family transporter subunit n=1 Tax=Lacticigenium naphthae TaxID=515351 RepID=UPI00040281DC|nr:OadG family transporter subunit [Lacticigenium naphthae]
MDQFTLMDGINLAIIGIVVVFSVLLLLMIAIELTAKLVNRKGETSQVGKERITAKNVQSVDKQHVAIITAVLNQEVNLKDYHIKVTRKKEVKKND